MSTYKSRNGKSSVTAIRSMKGNAAAVQDFLQPGDGLSVQAGQGRIWLVDSAEEEDRPRGRMGYSRRRHDPRDGTRVVHRQLRRRWNQGTAQAASGIEIRVSRVSQAGQAKEETQPAPRRHPISPRPKSKMPSLHRTTMRTKTTKTRTRTTEREPEVPTQHPSTPKPKTVAGRGSYDLASQWPRRDQLGTTPTDQR